MFLGIASMSQALSLVGYLFLDALNPSLSIPSNHDAARIRRIRRITVGQCLPYFLDIPASFAFFAPLLFCTVSQLACFVFLALHISGLFSLSDYVFPLIHCLWLFFPPVWWIFPAVSAASKDHNSGTQGRFTFMYLFRIKPSAEVPCASRMTLRSALAERLWVSDERRQGGASD